MQLFHYHPKYDRQLTTYFLSPAQLQFTAHPLDNLPIVLEQPSRQAIVALKDAQLICYFVLHQGEGVFPYSQNKQAVLLRAFSIDHHQQGKGYAQQVLHLLPVFIKHNFPEINEIVLAVNRENSRAQHVYQQAGFSSTKKQIATTNGILLVMHQQLD